MRWFAFMQFCFYFWWTEVIIHWQWLWSTGRENSGEKFDKLRVPLGLIFIVLKGHSFCSWTWKATYTRGVENETIWWSILDPLYGSARFRDWFACLQSRNLKLPPFHSHTTFVLYYRHTLSEQYNVPTLTLSKNGQTFGHRLTYLRERVQWIYGQVEELPRNERVSRESLKVSRFGSFCDFAVVQEIKFKSCFVVQDAF